MNPTENRKSMDDVLASIRRIVRAEKEPDAEAGAGAAPSYPSTAEEPLALTPEMRSDVGGGADGGEIDAEAISRPAGGARAAPPAAEQPVPDRDALRRMVREILLEELAGGRADEAMRGIVRDELVNGEIGGNISQNVLRLIRDEVAKALDGR